MLATSIRLKELLLVVFVIQFALIVSAIQNPTGNCNVENEADSSIARSTEPHRQWFSPAPSNVYLKDCNLSFLKKEYWRVFAHSDNDGSRAYIIPRPDRYGLEYGFCDGGDAGADASRNQFLQTKQLFEKYQLCQETVTDVHLVNNMDPTDALTITNLLHQKLVFRTIHHEGEFWSVDPFTSDDDVEAVCTLLESKYGSNHVAADFCQALRDRCDENGNCIEVAILPSRQVVEVFASGLNELYGIMDESNSNGDPDNGDDEQQDLKSSPDSGASASWRFSGATASLLQRMTIFIAMIGVPFFLNL